jgi:hypothetical protein
VAEPARVAVTDSSPIIALCAMGQLRLLVASVSFEPSPVARPAETSPLHPGERSAIAIALRYQQATVLLDEARARKTAARLGLHVVGTVGLIVEAKRRGLVDAAGPLLAALLDAGFRLRADLVARVLAALGEPPL